MITYFCDSSALVKRYVTEVGSSWLRARIRPEHDKSVVVSRLAVVEVSSALARRSREGTLSPTDILQALDAFYYHLASEYQVVELDAAMGRLASELVLKYPLRAYDAVQLAAAIRLQNIISQVGQAPFVLLTADNRLATFADSEGLSVNNPNDYS